MPSSSSFSETGSREHYRAIVEYSDDAIVSKTLAGVVTSWNAGAQKIFGYSAAEMLGQTILRLIPADRLDEEAAILEKIGRGEVVQHLETVRVHKDGRLIDVSITTSPVRDAAGRLVGASKIARDITAQKAATRRLRLTASVFTHSSEGIVIADRSARIVDCNGAFTRITGYEKSAALGQTQQMFLASRQGLEVLHEMRRALFHQSDWQGEIWCRRQGGEAFAAWVTVSKIRHGNGRTQNFVLLFSDLTVLMARQAQLERGAHFDPLTELPNRLLLLDRLHQAMTQCQRYQQSLALLYLDLDGFKQVNDSFGHDIGDQLLVTVSRRMKHALREMDTLARMGGDEFVAVLCDIASLPDCLQLATRVRDACGEPVLVEGLVLRVTVSIGVALYPQAGASKGDGDARALMRRADQAMYEAKQAGKNRIQLADAVRGP